MTSVIIAAFNEAAVIGRNLDLLLAGAEPGELDVVVVANGCTDDTAEVARRRGVRVLDLAEPGKAGALNAGDAAAEAHPAGVPRRRHRDECRHGPNARGSLDQTVPTGRRTTPLVAVPARRLVLEGRPIAVRAYYAIQSRLPRPRGPGCTAGG